VFVVTVPPAYAAEPPADLKPEAKFLPDDCQMVAVVRVEQLLASEAFKALEKESPLVARQRKVFAANMPLPLEQIDRIVLGGPVTGEGEGLFVIHTRKKIDRRDVVWGHTAFDLPSPTKVGAFELNRRRNESYSIVAPDLLVFGKESVVRAALLRNQEPQFSAALDGALKEADPSATVVFALDVIGVHKSRRGSAVPFIPGLQMVAAEEAAISLVLTAKLGDTIEVKASALPSLEKNAVTTLRNEAKGFGEFHQTTLKDRGAAGDVVDIFKLNVVAEEKRVTASTRFGGAALARLLNQLVR
jgi:hypothetical protein